MSTRLHVGNIPPSLEEREIRAMFDRFGLVETVEIARDSSTGRCRGFAIVAMSTDADADSAIRGLNFSQYSDRTIGVSRVR
ncbi:MAG: RNA-binding protein [Woeseiaceae bacterium]